MKANSMENAHHLLAEVGALLEGQPANVVKVVLLTLLRDTVRAECPPNDITGMAQKVAAFISLPA